MLRCLFIQAFAAFAGVVGCTGGTVRMRSEQSPPSVGEPGTAVLHPRLRLVSAVRL